MNPALIKLALDDLSSAQEHLQDAKTQVDESNDNTNSPHLQDALNALSICLSRVQPLVAANPVQEDTSSKGGKKQ